MVFSHLKIWWVSKKILVLSHVKNRSPLPRLKKKKLVTFSLKKILVLSHLKKSCGFLTQKKSGALSFKNSGGFLKNFGL